MRLPACPIHKYKDLASPRLRQAYLEGYASVSSVNPDSQQRCLTFYIGVLRVLRLNDNQSIPYACTKHSLC